MKGGGASRVCLLALLLGAGVSACGVGEEPTAQTKVPPVTHAAAVPEVPAPVLPPPPSTRQNALELREAGREPLAPLAVPVVTAVPQRLVAAISVQDRSSRRWPSPPAIRVTFATAVTTVAPDGSKVRDLEIERVVVDATSAEHKAVAGALSGHVQSLLTRGPGANVDTFEVLRIAGLDAQQGDLAPARTLASGMAHALGHLSVPVPADAVGVGAKWTVVRRVSFFGIPAWQTLDCTLVAVDGHQVEIRAGVTYALEAASSHDLPIDVRELAGGDGHATLHARIERTAATPVEMHLKGKVTLRGGGEFVGATRVVALDLRVDEDYLARSDGRVALYGTFAQGGLVRGTITPEATVWFNKRRVPVSPKGDFLLAFDRDFDVRALLSFRFPDGPSERHVVHIEPRAFEPIVVEGADEAASPPALDREAKRALAKARERMKDARAQVSDTPYFRDGVRLPVRGAIETPYGVHRVVGGRDEGVHWGVDIATPVGRPVRAPAAGVVVLAEADVPEMGTMVIVDHGHGLTSTLLHLQKLRVAEGAVVSGGQVVGLSGRSGTVEAPHLDWRMNLGDTRIDPLLALATSEDH